MIQTTRRLFPRLQRAAHAAPLGRNVSGPTHGRKRGPPATRGRALELLAASPDGCTEAIMIAHGFTVGVLANLVRSGSRPREPSVCALAVSTFAPYIRQ